MANVEEIELHTHSETPASPILLRSIKPVNPLSFGADTPEIPLGPLNVLIGPNAHF